MDSRLSGRGFSVTRRAALLAGVLAAGTFAAGTAAVAQDKPTLRFSAVVSEQDIRADMIKQFADAVKGDFIVQPYFGGTLFKQGTELVALQRGNLEMGNIAPQDVPSCVYGGSPATTPGDRTPTTSLPPTGR